MTVFAILKPFTHDYSSLTRYGETSLLFPLGLNITNTRVIADAAEKWFESFNWSEDFYLPSGNPVVVAVVSMVFQQIAIRDNQDEITFLEWDKHETRFVPKPFAILEE